MSKIKRALLMTLCAVCLVVTTVFGTLAYLTDTAAVTNTFTSAELFANPETQFKLWEHIATDIDEDGRYEFERGKTEDGNTYDILPGVNIPKDPTVDIKELEENAYLYLKVIDALPEGLSYSIDSTNWEELDKTLYPDVWVYKGDCAEDNVILASDDSKKTFLVNVLTQTTGSTGGNYAITVASEYNDTNDEITLTFNAYMVQAKGNGANAKAAWKNTYGAVTTGN